MHSKYVVFSLMLFCCLFYKPETISKNGLINQEIEVEVIENDNIKIYKTRLGITVEEFLKENKLKANNLLNYAYTLSDKDVINLEENNMKSINNITLKELEDIPYISSKNAKDIIEYRNTNGNFKSLDEVKKVKGIGDSKLKILKEYLTL